MMSAACWEETKNILCIRLDTLGDVLMTTPAMRAIKAGLPDRKLTLLTSQAGAPIGSLIPEVDATIIYEAPWMKAIVPGIDPKQDFELVDKLYRLGFDAAVIFTVFSQNPLPSALMAYLAGIPLRLAHCRENPYHLLTHWVPETDHRGQAQIRHEVRRQLDLVGSVGFQAQDDRLSLQISESAIRKAYGKLNAIGLEMDQPWLVMHPGASAASRRYPPQHFAAAAQRLADEYGFQILFTGIDSEKELIESIRMEMRADSVSLAGRLSIEEFSALLSLAPLLISNNTGPVHIASAVGTPVVDLYALTNPQHTAWKVPHRILFYDVPCKFCYKSTCPMGHHDCLRLVSPDAVIEAAISLYEETQNLIREKAERKI